MKLNQVSDFFIHNHKSLSNDQRVNQRIIVWVILISAIADLLGTILADSMQTYEILYLLLANAAISFTLLLIFRAGANKHILLNIFIAQHAASFAIQALYQGGLISPANASFFLLPAVAMLTLGKRSSIVWLIITSFILICFYVFQEDIGLPSRILSENERSYLFFNGVLFTNITIFIILIVYENQKNKAIHELHEINIDLIQTQEQLIHSEKMASLGELTAGIAHEIQNPLNFVNNFSDLNKELLEELIEELESGNYEEVKELSVNLIENEQKILFHGKRAEGIVKSMLQHSRGGEGKKELTDINELCDEYLRLSYHGLRAKDSNFNANFKVDLDKSLPKITVEPQDIGRVLLNLINNAFHAVSERARVNKEEYEPTVEIITKKSGKNIKITVKDNGNGIPDEIKSKIFQPFFTTKATGLGTGLGLSLSYDIITKGHSGKIDFESSSQNGTKFIISLPIKS